MTIDQAIPKNDYFKLIPIFKQDYTTRVDSFTDPVTGAAVSANDVNLFLLAIDIEASSDIKAKFGKITPKIKFMKKEDIKPGLEVHLGAYSNPPQNTK